jgi:hypothetical protein
MDVLQQNGNHSHIVSLLQSLILALKNRREGKSVLKQQYLPCTALRPWIDAIPDDRPISACKRNQIGVMHEEICCTSTIL